MTTRRGFRGSYTRSPRSFAPTAPSGPLPGDKKLDEGLNKDPLKTIQVPLPFPEDVTVKDVQYVGSYSWVADEKSPTIIVPGSPAEWQNKATLYQVPADKGNYFSDQNGYRMPKAVLQPLMTAVDLHSEDEGTSFDWSQVDIVTDRNNLRKLLRWIGSRGGLRPFRIDLQLAGKHTVLFNRWEKRYREAASGYTFGFNFEKASTVPGEGCENATAHHRIISYDMNGLKMTVRFEVDACVPAAATPSASTNVDALTSQLAGVSISKELPKSTVHGMTILRGGQVVSQSSLIELTTLSQKRYGLYDWNEAFPQLFLSQTPHHFLALHDRGKFVTIEKRRMESSKELLDASKDMKGNLGRLRKVLEEIQALVVKYGERGRLSLVCDETGVMKVYERVAKESCLSDEFMRKFD